MGTGEGARRGMRTGVLVLPAHLICQVMVWVKKNVLPPLVPCRLWQVRKLALGATRVRELPFPSPALAHGMAGTAPHLDSTLELTLLVGAQEGQVYRRGQERCH